MDPRANRLIAALPETLYQQWLPYLEAIDLPSGLVLYEPGQPVDHVYFPTAGIVSLLLAPGSGHLAEIATTGNEGMLGVSCLMGGGAANHQAVVLSAANGFRMPAQRVVEAFEQGGPVMHLLLRYNQALITQMAQRALCSRHHSLDQQLGHWLLGCLDRLATHRLAVTPARVSDALGVSPTALAEVLRTLQAEGLIACAEGLIDVLDVPAIERRGCECHAIVRKEHDRLLPARATG